MCSHSHIFLISSSSSNDIIPVISRIFGTSEHILKKIALVSAPHIDAVFICHHFSFLVRSPWCTHHFRFTLNANGNDKKQNQMLFYANEPKNNGKNSTCVRYIFVMYTFDNNNSEKWDFTGVLEKMLNKWYKYLNLLCQMACFHCKHTCSARAHSLGWFVILV